MIGDETITGINTEIRVFTGFQETGKQSGTHCVPGALSARLRATVVDEHPINGGAAEGVFGREPHGAGSDETLTRGFIFEPGKCLFFQEGGVKGFETDGIRVLENAAVMVEDFPPHNVGLAIDFRHAIDGVHTFEFHAPARDFVFGPPDVFVIWMFVFECIHEFGGGGFGADPQLMQDFWDGHRSAKYIFEANMCLNPCFKINFY